jgi:hypothetical protein
LLSLLFPADWIKDHMRLAMILYVVLDVFLMGPILFFLYGLALRARDAKRAGPGFLGADAHAQGQELFHVGVLALRAGRNIVVAHEFLELVGTFTAFVFEDWHGERILQGTAK